MAKADPMSGDGEGAGANKRDISPAISKAFEAVPEAGAAKRWYSSPYRLIWWLQTPWRRKFLPPPVKRGLRFLLHWIIDLNEYERQKIWDRDDSFHNLFVPSDERVVLPSITVVELFPPSHISTLRKAIERNAWSQRMRMAGDRDNVAILENTRSQAGWGGWDVANIAPLGSSPLMPDVKKQRIPEEFSFVTIRAEPLGPSVTAVLTSFTLSESAAMKLNEVWHADHEPSFKPLQKARPRTADRQWAGFERTQRVRRGLHDLCRGWVSEHCPGYFSSQHEVLPSFDFLLFENYDPAADEDRDRDFGDALRALGYTNPVTRVTSPSFPGLVFTEVEQNLCRPLGERMAGFVGNSAIVAGAQEHLKFHGSEPNKAIALMVTKYNSSLLSKIAVGDYLTSMIRRYATLRDRAQEHRKFSARYIRRLRETFLSMSLDLALASKDLAEHWDRKKKAWFDAEVPWEVNYSPSILRRDAEAGRKLREPDDLNKTLRKSQARQFERLDQLDRSYRDILSTVASLGGSLDAVRVGRIAIWVALGSLGVAAVTLLVTDVGDNSLLQLILDAF